MTTLDIQILSVNVKIELLQREDMKHREVYRSEHMSSVQTQKCGLNFKQTKLMNISITILQSHFYLSITPVHKTSDLVQKMKVTIIHHGYKQHARMTFGMFYLYTEAALLECDSNQG